METATALFTNRGYDAVGVQEVVNEAGVTKPTLYHHFGSKRGLFAAVQATIWREMMQRLEAPLVYRGDLPSTLAAVVAAFLELASDRPREMRLIISVQSGPTESEARKVMQPYVDTLYREIAELFLKAVENHGNMRGRHRAYAKSFLGMIFIYMTLVLDGEEEPTENLAQQIVHQFSHGIYS